MLFLVQYICTVHGMEWCQSNGDDGDGDKEMMMVWMIGWQKKDCGWSPAGVLWV